MFDEAQRAFDADKWRRSSEDAGFTAGKSEPEHFIEFAERIPGWCVVIGLIGSGQEIHVGEEAVSDNGERRSKGRRIRSEWAVHGPLAVGGRLRRQRSSRLRTGY